jgi:hypothetical protein
VKISKLNISFRCRTAPGISESSTNSRMRKSARDRDKDLKRGP